MFFVCYIVHQTCQTATTGDRLCSHCASMPFPSVSGSRFRPTVATSYKISCRNMVNSHCCDEEVQVFSFCRELTLLTGFNVWFYQTVYTVSALYWFPWPHLWSLTPTQPSPSTQACYVRPPKDKPTQHHWPHRTHNSGQNPVCFMMGQAHHNSVW